MFDALPHLVNEVSEVGTHRLQGLHPRTQLQYIHEVSYRWDHKDSRDSTLALNYNIYMKSARWEHKDSRDSTLALRYNIYMKSARWDHKDSRDSTLAHQGLQGLIMLLMFFLRISFSIINFVYSFLTTFLFCYYIINR